MKIVLAGAGAFFQYICDNGAYIARYDDLVNGKEEKIDVSKIDVSKIDVSTNGIELRDREFFVAIREKREPIACLARGLPCYRILQRLDRQIST